MAGLIFVEHGHSPDPAVAKWQDTLTPLWKRIGGECHLNREIDSLIADAGFRIRELKTDYLPGPRPMTYTYQGIAEIDAACAPPCSRRSLLFCQPARCLLLRRLCSAVRRGGTVHAFNQLFAGALAVCNNPSGGLCPFLAQRTESE